jgi:transcriptional regulator with XRE-family HTH domain
MHNLCLCIGHEKEDQMDTIEEELFGMLLKQFRERSGLKQLALAYLIGKRNRASIDAWERGLYVPSTPETVLSFAKALRLSESETDRLLMAAHYPPRYQRPNTQETVSRAEHREEIPVSSPTLSPCWNVPHHRTPFFTGVNYGFCLALSHFP